MLGKGVKRKLDEDEEGLEGEALAPAGAGTGAGTLAEGLSKVSYTLQRQTIFNISLMKLYNQRALTEPSLERRVLINNVLRRIQDELKQEGNLRPLLFPPSPPPDDPVDEGFREPQPAFAVLSVVATPLSSPPALSVPAPSPAAPAPTPLEACLTPASLLEADEGDADAAFGAPPSPRPHAAPSPAARDSFSSALDEIEELCPPASAAGGGSTGGAAGPTTTSSASSPCSPSLPILPPAQPGAAPPPRENGRAAKPDGLLQPSEARPAAVAAATEPRAMETLPPSGLDLSSSPSSSSSSGFLTDLALDDILFADIDTSMYDFDPCTSAAGSSPSKLSPVVTADDLLKTLSPYSGPAPQVNPSQPFKMDLTELDHIMEVLVGS